MKFLSVVAVLVIQALPACGETPEGVVELPLERLKWPIYHESRYSERVYDGVYTSRLDYYALRLSLGSPAQDVLLNVDTSSSFSWVLTPEVNNCKNNSCANASLFVPSKSGTFHSNSTSFSSLYLSGVDVHGNWAEDVLHLGDIKLDNFLFGVANETDFLRGVVGIGPSLQDVPYLPGENPPAIDLPGKLKEQGLISHRAYSLHLGSNADSRGSIVFGGLNRGAYEGDMYVFPMVPSVNNSMVKYDVAPSNTILEPAIQINGIYFMNDAGEQMPWFDFSLTAVLDSSQPESYLPSTLGFKMNEIGAEYYSGDYVSFNCTALETSHGGIGLDFSGVEFFINWRDLLQRGKTDDIFDLDFCYIGLAQSSESRFVLGSSVLRSLYVVYDLENLEIGIAKANTASPSEVYEKINGSIPGTKAPRYYSTNTTRYESPDIFTLDIGSLSTTQSDDLASFAPTSRPDVTIGGRASETGYITPYGFGTSLIDAPLAIANEEASSRTRSLNSSHSQSRSGSNDNAGRSQIDGSVYDNGRLNSGSSSSTHAISAGHGSSSSTSTLKAAANSTAPMPSNEASVHFIAVGSALAASLTLFAFLV